MLVPAVFKLRSQLAHVSPIQESRSSGSGCSRAVLTA
jgi:hypothetical protein